MLKFVAREDQMLPLPNQDVSRQHHYYGRTSEILRDDEGNPKGVKHHSDLEPFEIDENSKEGRDLLRQCRLELPVLPADAYTAGVVGIPFQEPKRVNDQWELPAPGEKKPKKGNSPGGNEGNK